MQRFCHELLIPLQICTAGHAAARFSGAVHQLASIACCDHCPLPRSYPALLPPPQFEANAKWDAWNAVKGKATATAKEVRHGPELLLLPCF